VTPSEHLAGPPRLRSGLRLVLQSGLRSGLLTFLVMFGGATGIRRRPNRAANDVDVDAVLFTDANADAVLFTDARTGVEAGVLVSARANMYDVTSMSAVSSMSAISSMASPAISMLSSVPLMFSPVTSMPDVTSMSSEKGNVLSSCFLTVYSKG
jgi:hypothetical protein